MKDDKQRVIEALKTKKLMESNQNSDFCKYIDITIKSIEKLAEYEDLEEQGLLIKLPCKVGDTIYRPVPKLYKTYTKSVVKEINISGNGISYNTDKGMDWRIDTIGRTAFLTQEDAEQVLKLKREITTRFEKVSEWNDELDFYMDLLEIGITVDMVRKYMNDETANHMQKYCEEHGLI